MALLCRETRVAVSKRNLHRFLLSAVGAEQRRYHHEQLTFLFAQPQKTDSSRTAFHSFRCPSAGFRLFMENVVGCARVLRKAVAGYYLDNCEKAAVRRTVCDCLKFASFSTFFMVPFAQILIPVIAIKFPRTVPSTFFETGYDAASLEIAQKMQRQLAQAFHQQVQDVKISDLVKDANFPDAKEVLDFQKEQARTLRLNGMSNHQLQSLAKLLGVKPTNTTGLLKWRLRHCMRRIRNEDRNHMWEGVDQLSKPELAAACRKRTIPFYGLTETEMRTHLDRWARLSSKRDISMCLLVWVQSSFNLDCRSSLTQQDALRNEVELNEVTNARCPSEQLKCKSAELIYRTHLEQALSLHRDVTQQQNQNHEQQKELEKQQTADEIDAQIDDIVDSLHDGHHLEGLLTRECSRGAASFRDSSSHVL